MGARALRHLHALSVGIVLLTALAGCRTDLGSVAAREGIEAAALVRLSATRAVAARRSGDAVEVIAFTASPEDAWSARVTASDAAGVITAHLVTMSGETAEGWNSHFFGTSPDAGSRVVVDGLGGQGGQVTDGAWVIAFRQRGLSPQLIAWRLLDATGAILESGTGITP